MSDFGTMVLVQRQDGQQQNVEDFARLNQAIQAVQAARTFRDAFEKAFRFRVSGSSEYAMVQTPVMLSEYWTEGLDEDEYGDRTAEQILDADRSEAQAACDALAKALGTEYTTELVCGMW